MEHFYYTKNSVKHFTCKVISYPNNVVKQLLIINLFTYKDTEG